jgi:hypothetical protein
MAGASRAQPRVNAGRKLKGVLCLPGLARSFVSGTSPQWEERVKAILKAELKRRNVGYRELAEKLTAMGIPETERNIANKISRGGFTAAFLLECLLAIGAKEIRID